MTKITDFIGKTFSGLGDDGQPVRFKVLKFHGEDQFLVKDLIEEGNRFPMKAWLIDGWREGRLVEEIDENPDARPGSALSMALERVKKHGGGLVFSTRAGSGANASTVHVFLIGKMRVVIHSYMDENIVDVYTPLSIAHNTEEALEALDIMILSGAAQK